MRFRDDLLWTIGGAVVGIPVLLVAARHPILGLASFGGVLLLLLMSVGNTARPGAALLILGLVMSTWNAVRVAGFTASDPVLVIGLLLILIGGARIGGTERRQLPRWVFIAPAGFTVVWAIGLALPPSESYIGRRYNPAIYGIVGGAGNSSTSNLIRIWLAMAIIPAAVAIAANWADLRPRRLADAWVLSAVVSGFVALTDRFGLTRIEPRLLGTVLNLSGRSTGLTVTANHLAVSAVLALPLALSWTGRGTPRWRLAGTAASLLLLTAVVLSGSAGGAVTAIFVLGVSYVYQPALRRNASKAAFALVLAVATLLGPLNQLLVAFVGNNRLDRSASSGTLASNLDRMRLGEQAWRDFYYRPLQGSGLTYIASGHRVFLQLLAASGLIGLIGMTVWVAKALRAGVSVARASSDTDDRDVAGAAVISLAAFVLIGLVENQIVDRYLYITVGLILAVQMRAAIGQTGEQQTAPAKSQLACSEV